jgi:hypothetical protein
MKKLFVAILTIVMLLEFAPYVDARGGRGGGRGRGRGRSGWGRNRGKEAAAKAEAKVRVLRNDAYEKEAERTADRVI